MKKTFVNQIRSEISFLQSSEIKELVHDADIGCCHADCITIEKRKMKLKKLLKPIKRSK